MKYLALVGFILAITVTSIFFMEQNHRIGMLRAEVLECRDRVLFLSTTDHRCHQRLESCLVQASALAEVYDVE